MDKLKKEHRALWDLVYESLTRTLPPHAIKTWFNSAKPISYSEKNLTLSVPSQFFSEWIDSHYKEQLVFALRSVTDDPRSTFSLIVSKEEKEAQNVSSLSPQKSKRKSNNANKSYRFKNFIEGSNNEFAKNASKSVANSPGVSNFNPLIIYGGVGLGKTHLLHAIGNEAFKKSPDLNIVLVTSEQFTLDFVNSLRKGKTLEFTRLYRSADILLIDDIQFFRGKEQTQEQFFHTFNELYQSGRQIVMTTDIVPKDMKGLQERLISRFQSGLTVDIQPPDFEIRVAILLEKSEQNGLNIGYESIEFIARHIKNNIRDLEGTIIRILAKSSLMNKEIDFNLIKEVVKERVGSSFSPELTIEDVVKKVSIITGIKEREITGKSRKKEIAEARQLSMFLSRNIIGSSLSKTGLYFSGRDHSTVIHAIKTINKKQKTDKRLKNQINLAIQELDLSF